MKFLLVLLTGFVASTTTTNNWLNKNEVKVITGKFYTLGDSLSDTGALTQGGANWVRAIAHVLPFKKFTLENPYYQGRSFSTGAPAAEIVAQKLKQQFNPAWKFTMNNKVYEQVGENYAFGGAMAGVDDSAAGLILNNFSIAKQAEALVSQHKIAKSDQFFMEIGGNDLTAIVKQDNWWKRQLKINEAINGEINALNTLIQHGAQKIVLSDVPDISLTPSYNQNKAMQQLSHQIWQSYSNNWNSTFRNYMIQNPGKIKIFDGAREFQKVLNNFAKLDKNNNIINQAVSANLWTWDFFWKGDIDVKFSQGVTPENLYHYFFVDQIHPNKYVHEQIAKALIKFFQ